MKCFALACVLWLCLSGSALSQDGMIGTVRVVEGRASILRGETILPAQTGTPLQQGDILETGEEGTLGVILRDDTMLSPGHNTRIVLDQFVFAPAEGELGCVTKMARGTFVYISGQISKLAPESVCFGTPLAVLGIRGTRFPGHVE